MRDDQAHGLRQIFARRTCKVAAICGSEGTRVCIEVAAALIVMGYRVAVLDRTVGEGARAIGRRARYDLAHVLEGDCTLDKALLTGTHNVTVLPSARGLDRLATESTDWQATLQKALPALGAGFDLWLVNGLLPGHAPDAPMVLAINASAPSITNAYGHIKALARAQGRRRFGVIVDGSATAHAARRVHECVADTARRFLAADLELYGWLPPEGSDKAAQRSRAEAYTRIADALMTCLSHPPLLRTGS